MNQPRNGSQVLGSLLSDEKESAMGTVKEKRVPGRSRSVCKGPEPEGAWLIEEGEGDWSWEW